MRPPSMFVDIPIDTIFLEFNYFNYDNVKPSNNYYFLM
jgi:hypothetical protein